MQAKSFLQAQKNEQDGVACMGTGIRTSRSDQYSQSKNSTKSFLAIPVHLIGPCLPLKEGMFLNETITIHIRLVGGLSNTVVVLLSDERTRLIGVQRWGGYVRHPILLMSHPAERLNVSASSILLLVFLHSNFGFTDHLTLAF
jgi:hypothetical protein